MDDRPRRYRYKAFISYSHDTDRLFAPQLQRELEGLAKPWYRRHAITLFRDTTDLAVNQALWARIVEAMDDCERLLVLASPQAAQSPWVIKELEHWRDRRGTAAIAIALTGGNIVWNETVKDFDWRVTDAIPRQLTGAFDTEPLWADFRSAKIDGSSAAAFRESAIRLCAGLRGVAPRDLESDDLYQHRRTIRVFGAIISTLVVLTLAVIAVAIYAFAQRNTAEARELAAQADLLANDTYASTERTTLLALESLKKSELPDNRRILGKTLPLLLPHVTTLPPEGVTEAQFSGDRRYLATASKNGALSVFDASTWKSVASFSLARSLSEVTFSSDGRMIAAGSEDGTIIVSETTGAEIYRFSLGDYVSTMSFGLRHRVLAAVGSDGRLALVDATGHKLGTKFPRKGVNAFAFTDDDAHIAIGEHDTVRMLAVETGRERWRQRFAGDVNTVVYSPPNGYLGVGWADADGGGSAVLDSRNGKTLWRRSYEGGIGTLRFTRDGSKVAIVSPEDIVNVLDVRTGGDVTGFRVSDTVADMAFSLDGSHLAVGSEDGTTSVLDLDRRIERGRLEHGGSSVGIGGDGRSLITVDKDGRVYVYSITTLNEISRIRFSNYAYSAAFGRAGTVLAVGTGRGVQLFDASSGKHSRQVGPAAPANSIAFSADGRYVAAAYTGRASVFDTESGRQTFDISHEGDVATIALSGTGRYFATPESDDSARAWDVTTGRPVAELKLKSPLRAIGLSSDGRLLGAAGKDGHIHIIEIGTSASRSRTTDITGGGDIQTIAFSPNARYLAIGNREGFLRVVEISSGELVYEWPHPQPLSAVYFSGKGEYVITESQPDTPTKLGAVTRLFSMSDGGEWARVTATNRLGAASLDATETTLLTATSYFGTGIIGVERHALSRDALMMTGCSLVSRNLNCAEWRRYRRGAQYEPTCPNLPVPSCRPR
jgi:WD40 repeat protein